MSRHRFVKTLDIDDELDEFEGDDDYEEEYDPNEDPQMKEALAQARIVLGSEFPDKEIQDSLYYYYYDVEKTVNYLLGVYIYLRNTRKLTRCRQKGKGNSKANKDAQISTKEIRG
jgi:elongation factor 1 alpha-like protein